MLEDRCRASLAAIESGGPSTDVLPKTLGSPKAVHKEWIVDSRDGFSVPALSIRRANPPHLRGGLTIQIRSAVDIEKVSGTHVITTKVSIGALKCKLAPQKLTPNHQFEENSFNFTLAGNEDFLRIRLTTATVLKENCGVAKISIPVLLSILCPDMSPEMARSKKPVPAAGPSVGEHKRTQSISVANDEAKRVLALVEASTLAPNLKASLAAQLKEDISGGEFYEAWFRVGKGDKRTEHCGAILLRMRFNPDWSANAAPPAKLTPEMSAGISAAEARAARAEKMRAAHPEGIKRGKSLSSPRSSHNQPPQTAQQKLALLQQLEPSIAKKLPKFFGCTLAQAAEFAIGTQIPTVITDCVNFLKTNGIREEGIFRVPGNNEAIQLLKNGYEQTKDEGKATVAGTLALKANKVAGPHEIGGLLKLYLRSLPEPIFPFATYKPLLALTDNMKNITDPPTGKLLEQANELRALLMKMPQQNLDTVRFLLVFLSSVSALSAVNLMEVKNLAIVFAPTVLRPAPDSESLEDVEMMTDLLSEMPRSINAVEVMIRLGKHLFPNTPPPRSDVAKPAGAPDTPRMGSNVNNAAPSNTPRGSVHNATTPSSLGSTPTGEPRPPSYSHTMGPPPPRPVPPSGTRPSAKSAAASPARATAPTPVKNLEF